MIITMRLQMQSFGTPLNGGRLWPSRETLECTWQHLLHCKLNYFVFVFADRIALMILQLDGSREIAQFLNGFFVIAVKAAVVWIRRLSPLLIFLGSLLIVTFHSRCGHIWCLMDSVAQVRKSVLEAPDWSTFASFGLSFGCPFAD